jgi:hypothetical protein
MSLAHKTLVEDERAPVRRGLADCVQRVLALLFGVATGDPCCAGGPAAAEVCLDRRLCAQSRSPPPRPLRSSSDSALLSLQSALPLSLEAEPRERKSRVRDSFRFWKHRGVLLNICEVAGSRAQLFSEDRHALADSTDELGVVSGALQIFAMLLRTAPADAWLRDVLEGAPREVRLAAAVSVSLALKFELEEASRAVVRALYTHALGLDPYTVSQCELATCIAAWEASALREVDVFACLQDNARARAVSKVVAFLEQGRIEDLTARTAVRLAFFLAFHSHALLADLPCAPSLKDYGEAVAVLAATCAAIAWRLRVPFVGSKTTRRLAGLLGKWLSKLEGLQMEVGGTFTMLHSMERSATLRSTLAAAAVHLK